jgi:hypothetical protein
MALACEPRVQSEKLLFQKPLTPNTVSVTTCHPLGPPPVDSVLVLDVPVRSRSEVEQTEGRIYVAYEGQIEGSFLSRRLSAGGNWYWSSSPRAIQRKAGQPRA